MSTFQTAPAQENPFTGKTLKNMQLGFTACRRKNAFFLLLFVARWAHFFDFIARSHTLIFSSFSFCFYVFFASYYWVATAHNAQCGCVVYCYNLEGHVCVCARL